MKKTQNTEMTEKAVKKMIFSRVVEAAFIHGVVTEKDFSDKKLLKRKLLKIVSKENMQTIVLYGDSLLEEAQRYVVNKDYQYAYTFYATYFEHFINEVLDIWRIKKNFQHKITNSMVRRFSLEDKYTWVLDLLELPVFSKSIWNIVKDIVEKRNEFIHFKYRPEIIDEGETEDKDWIKDYESIKKAIKYTKSYRTRIVYSGSKIKKYIK